MDPLGGYGMMRALPLQLSSLETGRYAETLGIAGSRVPTTPNGQPITDQASRLISDIAQKVMMQT